LDAVTQVLPPGLPVLIRPPIEGIHLRAIHGAEPAKDRQIDGERAAITSTSAGTTSHRAVKNAMPWIVFGIRGPGGSRTGSVVAVAMSSPVRTGHRNYSVQVVHCIRAQSWAAFAVKPLLAARLGRRILARHYVSRITRRRRQRCQRGVDRCAGWSRAWIPRAQEFARLTSENKTM
jgi:hypothetical protein